MANEFEIRQRLEFWRAALVKLREAYIAIADGGVKKFTIDDRELTQLDLPDLQKQIEAAEKKVDELESQLSGARPRKAFGIIPRDW